MLFLSKVYISKYFTIWINLLPIYTRFSNCTGATAGRSALSSAFHLGPESSTACTSSDESSVRSE
jgi:hypothetical protein